MITNAKNICNNEFSCIQGRNRTGTGTLLGTETYSSQIFQKQTPVSKSILYSVLPSIMMTSEPRSVRTSSIHLEVWWNELELVISYTTTATVESRM